MLRVHIRVHIRVQIRVHIRGISLVRRVDVCDLPYV